MINFLSVKGMNPKEESETLMNAMLPVATKMLRTYAEFYPYGGYMKLDGEIVHVGAQDPETDRPKSKYLIDLLQKTFQELAHDKKCKATAIVYDVMVVLPQSDRKRSAIQVNLDHADNYSVQVFFPYDILKSEVVFGQIFAQKGESNLFQRKCSAS